MARRPLPARAPRSSAPAWRCCPAACASFGSMTSGVPAAPRPGAGRFACHAPPGRRSAPRAAVVLPSLARAWPLPGCVACPGGPGCRRLLGPVPAAAAPSHHPRHAAPLRRAPRALLAADPPRLPRLAGPPRRPSPPRLAAARPPAFRRFPGPHGALALAPPLPPAPRALAPSRSCPPLPAAPRLSGPVALPPRSPPRLSLPYPAPRGGWPLPCDRAWALPRLGVPAWPRRRPWWCFLLPAPPAPALLWGPCAPAPRRLAGAVLGVFRGPPAAALPLWAPGPPFGPVASPSPSRRPAALRPAARAVDSGCPGGLLPARPRPLCCRCGLPGPLACGGGAACGGLRCVAAGLGPAVPLPRRRAFPRLLRPARPSPAPGVCPPSPPLPTQRGGAAPGRQRPAGARAAGARCGVPCRGAGPARPCRCSCRPRAGGFPLRPPALAALRSRFRCRRPAGAGLGGALRAPLPARRPPSPRRVPVAGSGRLASPRPAWRPALRARAGGPPAPPLPPRAGAHPVPPARLTCSLPPSRALPAALRRRPPGPAAAPCGRSLPPPSHLSPPGGGGPAQRSGCCRTSSSLALSSWRRRRGRASARSTGSSRRSRRRPGVPPRGSCAHCRRPLPSPAGPVLQAGLLGPPAARCRPHGRPAPWAAWPASVPSLPAAPPRPRAVPRRGRGSPPGRWWRPLPPPSRSPLPGGGLPSLPAPLPAAAGAVVVPRHASIDYPARPPPLRGRGCRRPSPVRSGACRAGRRASGLRGASARPSRPPAFRRPRLPPPAVSPLPRRRWPGRPTLGLPRGLGLAVDGPVPPAPRLGRAAALGGLLLALRVLHPAALGAPRPHHPG